MPVENLFRPESVLGFLFTLGRVAAVFAFLPLTAFRQAPGVAKISLSLCLSLILWPQWRSLTVYRGASEVFAAILGDMGLGLAIGLITAMALEMFAVAAQIVSLQAGLAYASTIDPTSGADSLVLVTAAQLVGGLLFFALGGDRMVVRILADSFRLCPPGTCTVLHSTDAVIRFSGLMLSSGLRLAAPVIALLLLTDVSLAVLGRLQAQLQLVALTTPVKIASTLLLLSLTVGSHISLFSSALASGIRLAEEILLGNR